MARAADGVTNAEREELDLLDGRVRCSVRE
jgi:hypothetical protein